MLMIVARPVNNNANQENWILESISDVVIFQWYWCTIAAMRTVLVSTPNGNSGVRDSMNIPMLPAVMYCGLLSETPSGKSLEITGSVSMGAPNNGWTPNQRIKVSIRTKNETIYLLFCQGAFLFRSSSSLFLMPPHEQIGHSSTLCRSAGQKARPK